MPAITITTDNGQATRLAAAVGAALDLGRAATTNEVKTFIVDHLRNVVVQHERAVAQPVSVPAFDPT